MRRIFIVPAHAARMLPLLALAPLFNLWFGSSDRGSIIFVAFATFAIVFVIALSAIQNVPAYYLHYAQSLGASRKRGYFTVVLPAALPHIRGGILLALGFGWSMVIASEFLGQTAGLGNIVNQAQLNGRTNTLSVVGLVVMIYGALSFLLATRVFDYVIRWHE
jgi:sulfonate transport system permease protein